MQIRKSTLKGDRPLCHVDPSHTVHGHGSYDRFENCNSSEQEDIRRFLCVLCGHTFSVLPDRFLPYRPISVAKVEAHFDAQANHFSVGRISHEELAWFLPYNARNQRKKDTAIP